MLALSPGFPMGPLLRLLNPLSALAGQLSNIFVPSLFNLGPSNAASNGASRLLFGAADLETCNNKIHAP